MYNLVIDVGNSFTKAAVFKGNEIIKVFSGEDINTSFAEINSYSITNIIVSAVKDVPEAIQNSINTFSSVIYLDHNTSLPIQNLYKSPETLGRDRIAGVVGALSHFKKGPLLVIDAGTCITYDYLNKENAYEGGAISPGINMRFKALNHFTGKLPLIHFRKSFELVGNTTENSILSGVLAGAVKEMEGIINEYLAENNDLKVLITGGDCIFFESNVKSKIFAIPNLVLIGLNKILNYNVK